MKKKHFINIICITLAFMGYAQKSNLTIVAEFPYAKEGDTIKFSKRIGNFPLTSYYNKEEITVVKNKTIQYSLPSQVDGLFTALAPPYHFSAVVFYAEPNDTIRFTKSKDSVTFYGKNSVVNKMLNNRKFLNPQSDRKYDYDAVFKKHNFAEAIINEVNTHLDSVMLYYEKMRNNNQISSNCYDFLQNFITQYYDFTLGRMSDNLYKNTANERLQYKLDSVEACKLYKHYNSKYELFFEKNLNSNSLLSQNIYATAAYLAKVNKQADAKRYWNKYDDLFSKTMVNFGNVDFVKSEVYKEIYIADAIFMAIKFKTITNQIELNKVYDDFIRTFPKSVYTKPLSESISEYFKVENKKGLPHDFTGFLATYTKNIGIVKSEVEFSSLNSFNEFLENNFKNEHVFIDFWATYCLPCIQEFQFNSELMTFLQEKNIKNMYLSIDKDENQKLWKKLVSEYNLSGYHLFVGSENTDKILKIIEYIPRYMIYNFKTKKLVPLLGKPQEKEVFYNNILNIVE